MDQETHGLYQQSLERQSYELLGMDVSPSQLGGSVSRSEEPKVPASYDTMMVESYEERLAKAARIQGLRIPRPSGRKYWVDFNSMLKIATECEGDFIRPYVPAVEDDCEIRMDCRIDARL